MQTYETIKQLYNKENESIIKVLQYIAKETGYLSKGNVQYKRLFYKVLRPRFIAIASRHNLGVKSISRKQYNRLRKYRRGKFPIIICIYIEALYEIMLGYKKKAELSPVINDISYTQYMLDGLRDEIFFLVNNNGLLDPGKQQIYDEIYNDIIQLDNHTGNSHFNIYNNIW